MCGILVSSDAKTPIELFEKGLQTLWDRGPDDQRIVIKKEGIFGFCRLAIMGLNEKGMQPFAFEDMTLVCNGEVYCFREMKKKLESKYSFVSDSDCEIILPWYKEEGFAMFAKLDSEFALVLYDPRVGLVAARDPIGIRPLFYGYTENGKIAFGSTVASLQPFADDIRPFPPGTYYANGEFVAYTKIYQTEKVSEDDVETACVKIHDLLVDGVKKRMDADAKVGYLLSGGLDSSLVCAIAAKYSDKPIKTFSIGMESDAIDLKYARQVADFIHSDHTEFHMSEKDILSALAKVIHDLATFDITTVRASLGMYILCQKIKEVSDVKVLLTGEVSDELFGYKYTDFAPSATAFQSEAEKRVKELHLYDVLRADRCISQNHMEGRVPFGDLAFVRYVMSIDPKLKMNTYNMGKYLLRHAFEKDGLLPKTILFRDKAAFSDAVGHSLADDLKAYAERMYTDEDFENKVKQFDHCPPFTKESLLYREIFSSFYPNCDTLIPAYWMPNPEWEGCKVDDPSARYLKNYGASAY